MGFRFKTAVALVSAVIALTVVFANIGDAVAATPHKLTTDVKAELKHALLAAAESKPLTIAGQGYHGGIPPIDPPPGNAWTVGNCPNSYGAIFWTPEDTCAFYDYSNTNDYFMVVLIGVPGGFGEISPENDSDPVWWV